MSLKDRIEADRLRVFLRRDHFADDHTWNGIPFLCVADEETALKRKNNNARETVLYVREEDWPGRKVPNEHGFLDNRHMKIMQIQEDMGLLTIVLSTVMPKAVASE